MAPRREFQKGYWWKHSPLRQKMPAFWRWQYHEMIGKNSSSHGVSWILEDPVVLLLKVEAET